eukprot:TRINITY_DN11990_c0_g1_i1.p1 TRINITY_DN11990_c0_g1~~TRINITY_DN11990_c0_g1_i1.p1  ORF type:complete len:358 (+),score=43.32 TRINITY_DN11990_c0_g1_i1:46-1119(+)
MKRKLLFAGLAGCGILTMWDGWKGPFLRSLPSRTFSRVWGTVLNKDLPYSVRPAAIRLYSSLTGVNLDEVDGDLHSFRNVGEFFCRSVKKGVHSIDQKTDLVSPVDGRVMSFGEITSDMLPAVKGTTYAWKEFLGVDSSSSSLSSLSPSLPASPSPLSSQKLYHCIIYLAPGDYHRIHSPTDCCISWRRHFPGDLFPVLPALAQYIPNVFSKNERIVLSGKWKEHCFFSLTPVGAYNVGSIQLAKDPEVVTNRPPQKAHVYDCAHPYGPNSGSYIKSYTPSVSSPSGQAWQKGEEVARFRMGSTVVLIFQCPSNEDFQFHVHPQQRVRVGQPLGDCIRPPTHSFSNQSRPISSNKPS